MNSIITPKALFVLLCLVITIDLSGQQPNEIGCASPNGEIIINEIGNMSESKDGDLAGEFIELLVIGEDPTLPVNLEGYIIDDNHSSSSINGSTSGHIQLGSCFTEVMPGSIILIYDDQRSFPGINATDDGAPNHAGLYQIPFNSDCLVKVSACPNSQDLGYNCAPDPTGGDTGGWTVDTGSGGEVLSDWRDYIHLNDVKDVVQIRDSKYQLVHALMWWPTEDVPTEDETGLIRDKSFVFPNQNSPQAVKVYDGSIAGKSVSFSSDDYLVQRDFSVISHGYTPGRANEAANQIFIDEFKPIVCPGEALVLGCEGNSSYCYVWEGDSDTYPLQGGMATVYPEREGNYARTTLDGEGNLINKTSFFVRTHSSFSGTVVEEQLTSADCIAEAVFRFTVTPISETVTYAYLWSTGEKTPAIEGLGDQAYTVTITSNNGCQIVETVAPAGNPSMLGQVTIEASTPMLCGDNPVQLTTSFQNYSGNRTCWNSGRPTFFQSRGNGLLQHGH